MIQIIIDIAVIIFAVVVVSDCYVIVPTGYVGALMFFTRRLRWKPMKEGFHFKPPFIFRVALISLKLHKAEANFSFLAQKEKSIDEKKDGDKDKKKKGPGLEVFIEGELNFIADPTVFEQEEAEGVFGQPLIVRIGDDLETLISGIVSSTKDEVGKLGGEYAGTDFVDNRKVLADIINCFLRLLKPPHIKHENGVNGCNITDCHGKLEPGENIFEFYKKHADFVLKVLKHEKDSKEDHSQIELRYGVDIIVYNLTKVDYTPDVKRAFEEEQETRALRGVFQDRLSDMKDALTAMGSTGTAQLAVNFVETTYNEEVSRREVISVEGSPSAVLVPSSFGGSGKKGGN